MNIVINEPLVKRNKMIAQGSMIGGLLVLAGGMYVSFRYPTQFNIAMGALILGFMLSQVGIYFSNRWGRSPRPDEMISSGLKGLDGRYTLYHYKTSTPHLLLGPAGLWILMPHFQRGLITFSNGRWHQKGGNLYMKFMAQEGLGRPDLEVLAAEGALKERLAKHLEADQIPPIHTALVFLHAKTEIKIADDQEAPAETILLKDLKELIRKSAKNKSLSADRIALVEDALKSK